ncbi:MAG: RnfABCDGE type electron transport complex subunit D [Bacilli bacterium]|nr:RnfABCDGE type electron transport complex subunit D [Bacilli bacterium]
MKYAIDSGPHIRDEDSTDLIYKRLLLVLIPLLLFSVYKNVFLVFIENKYPLLDVFYPLIVIIVACITSFFTERIYLKIESNRLGYKKNLPFYSIIPGLFLSLLLPINVPIYVVILGAIVATLFGKMIYGGFGENLFNPAALGYVIIILLFGSLLSNFSNYLNPLELEKYSSVVTLDYTSINYNNLVAPYGNLFNFLFGTVPGSIGTTNAFLILLSFVFLSILKVIKWKVTLSYLLTVFIMTFMIASNHGEGIWFPIFNLLSGGLLFIAVFMTDPVTTPTTSVGQILYGLGLGVLTVCVRFLTDNPERILVAVILMNILVLSLDRLGVKSKQDSNYGYIFVLIGVIFAVIVSYFVSKTI